MLKIKKPHDYFVRHSLSDLVNAGMFLGKFIAQDILEQVHLDRLQNGKETYISEGLNESIADLLYIIPSRKGKKHMTCMCC